MIELPQKPTRIVVGDQDSFLVEFVGKNLAIKPLIQGVKTNLFIFTKAEQFHCTLLSGPLSKLQYIVRLKNKKYFIKKLNIKRQRKEIIVWILEYRKHLGKQCHEVTLRIKNNRKEEIELLPNDLNIYCAKSAVPISSVYLDSLKVAPGSEIKARLLVQLDNIKRCSALNLELALSDEDSLFFPFNMRSFR